MHRAVAEILSNSGGLISRRNYPELSSQIDVAVRQGDLVRVLPTVYAHRDICRDWRVLTQAVNLWDTNAVVVGEAAAALTFWESRTPKAVEIATSRTRLRFPGFTFTQRTIPQELIMVRRCIRLSAPALTAIDLAPKFHGNSIDDALRGRQATVAGMYEALALTQGRIGNTSRRRLLLDSRAEPWSSGERIAHGLLRAASITRWHANVPIICDGLTFYQDIALDDCPVVAEVDGKVHMRPEKFESDRFRGNLLLLAGKQVLHYTHRMLTEEPEWFVDTVQRAIQQFSEGPKVENRIPVHYKTSPTWGNARRAR